MWKCAFSSQLPFSNRDTIMKEAIHKLKDMQLSIHNDSSNEECDWIAEDLPKAKPSLENEPENHKNRSECRRITYIQQTHAQ